MAVDLNFVSGMIINIALLLGGIILIGSFVFFGFRLYLNWKRHDTVTLIFSKDGYGSTSLEFDAGGIYVDPKTGNKRFFLKGNNVGMNPDKIPYIRSSKGKKYVLLRKKGLKNFEYITLEQLFHDNPTILVGEEDVNWAINAYERQKKMFGSTLLQQLLPYIGIALMGLFILAMVVVTFQHIGVLGDVAKSFEQAAKAFAQMQSGTTVLPGTNG